jgi:hypothetical protein
LKPPGSELEQLLTSRLVTLVEELLDAHLDTIQLGDELCFDGTWRVHLDYLRALQRRGSEVVADLTR